MTARAGRLGPWALDVALAAALGALQTLAFVFTEAWWLPLLAIGVLAARAARVAPGRAAWLGGAYGCGWLVAGTWWLFVSMHFYGGLPAWMAALAVFALSAFLSLYLAAALWAFARWRSGRRAADAALFAGGWLLAELARGVLFTGFPWVAAGYSQVDAPLAALAPWVGVYGIGAAMAALAAWVALAPAGGGRGVLIAWGPPLVLLAACAGLGAKDFSAPAGSISVALLQGNVPQDEKFETTHQAAALEWHLSALLGARAQLVVAPETAIPFLPQQMPDGLWDALAQRFAEGRSAALVGVPLGDEAAGYTNSAVGFAPGRAGFYRYDKHHLVPFGEFIPTGFRWFTQLMNIPLGDFNRGPAVAPSFEAMDQRIGPNICYEDLFGEELAGRFVDAGTAPTILANLSNIGWFGRTIAIDQHLQISRLRTLELQRPMIRATNTGATAVIDHRGRVRRWLEPHTRGVLEGTVEGRSGTTPFAAWAGRFGLAPLALLGGLPLLLAWRRPGRRQAAA